MTGNQNRWFLIAILILGIFATVVTFRNRLFTLDTQAKFGLDIQGGMRVVLRAKKEEYKGGSWSASNLEAVRRILENRVNATGVSEPVILTKPDDQVIVELPGIKDKQKALDQLQSTASLQFYLIPQLNNNEWIIDSRTVKDAQGRETKEEVLVSSATGQPITPEQLEVLVFSRPPIVSGKDLLPNCAAVPNPASGRFVITFEFNSEGARIFETTTRANIGKPLAVFLDKKLLTAPTIQGVIPGKGEISGNFTPESAKALADQLNAGALPVPLEIVELRDLEATLGKEAVDATYKAGLLGLGLVLVFMLFFYRLPGALACLALLLYTVFSIAAFKLIPVTLTLPGIAGFILSIGMAVDANILIFERMKEELMSGKTLRTSIDTGFKRAFTAILDSNVCTLITCFILYNFGTGPIRGFALTLGLGVAISMFTAISVTRTFLFSLVGFGFAQNAALYGIGGRFHPGIKNVMRYKWHYLIFSGLITVPGLVAWLFMGGIKYNIDFKGGTELQIPFAQRHSAGEIQKALIEIDPRYRDSRVVVATGTGNTNIAYVTTVSLSQEQRQQVMQGLIQKVGPLQAGLKENFSDVSGLVSKELTLEAIKSIVFASALIVLYLAFRFSMGGFKEGLKYGLCAVAALVHDVAVVWGAFAILGLALGWQVDGLFVTAMLTVIGFSVHDTIVVFDRVRENLQHRARDESFSDLADRSIDQTFARSLYTSFTVLLTLVALFLFGGSAIHQFTGALIIGVASGTYSSIFNASVLLVLWKQRDLGLAAGGAGAPKSGLGSRPTVAAPGDRPLVTPKATPALAEATAEPETNGAAQPKDESAKRPKPARKKPLRRPRM